ncbi:hypothetical protein JCM10207_000401 [Rhodosporidiobolus poonsookiae]
MTGRRTAQAPPHRRTRRRPEDSINKLMRNLAAYHPTWGLYHRQLTDLLGLYTASVHHWTNEQKTALIRSLMSLQSLLHQGALNEASPFLSRLTPPPWLTRRVLPSGRTEPATSCATSRTSATAPTQRTVLPPLKYIHCYPRLLPALRELCSPFSHGREQASHQYTVLNEHTTPADHQEHQQYPAHAELSDDDEDEAHALAHRDPYRRLHHRQALIYGQRYALGGL